jgi:hypothetical protein
MTSIGLPKKIKNPIIRLNIKEYIESLSSLEYQQRIWIERADPKISDCFDDVIAFLFDLAGLEDDLPENNLPNIGLFFYDEAEARAVSQVIRAVNTVLNEQGLEASDLEYMHSRHWPEVLQTAQQAIDLLTLNDTRYQTNYDINQ